MSAQSATDFIPTPYATSTNVVWADDLAELLDARINELAEGRDVITVTTAALAGSDGGTLGVLVTVVWRES
jgi:hypothetical protein